MQVYLRKGLHYLGGEMTATLDIANIIVKEKFRKQGLFRDFLRDAEALGYPIYVECIHNPWLPQVLEQRGYDIIDKDDDVCAFLPGSEVPSWIRQFK